MNTDRKSFEQFIQYGDKLGIILATTFVIMTAALSASFLVNFKVTKEDAMRYIARHKWYLIQLAMGKLSHSELLNSIEIPIVKANRVSWRHEIAKRYNALLPVEVDAFNAHRR